MATDPSEPAVVIVGAGVTGTATAHALAPDHDVTVIDKGMVAGDTTARASGFLATPEAFPRQPQMGEYCMDFFRTFDGTGIYTFHECPTVHVVGEEAVDRARDYAEGEADAGRPVRFRTPAEIEGDYDGEFDLSGCGGALVYDNTGYTNPFDYAVSLKHVAETEGARFYTDTTVEEIVAADGAVEGVRTRHGIVEADYVVVATGWRSNDLLGHHAQIPVKPARWESVILDPPGEMPTEYPMGTDWVKHGIYWRPTPEGYLLVGGNPIPVEERGKRTLSVTDEFLEVVTERAPDMIASAVDAAVVRDECCPTGAAGTPDTMPIIDAPPEAPNGTIVAAGFQRGGILASPATAAVVRAHVTGEDVPFPTDAFELDRFEDTSPDFDIKSYVTRST